MRDEALRKCPLMTRVTSHKEICVGGYRNRDFRQFFELTPIQLPFLLPSLPRRDLSVNNSCPVLKFSYVQCCSFCVTPHLEEPTSSQWMVTWMSRVMIGVKNRVLLHDMTDINIPKMATSDISSN